MDSNENTTPKKRKLGIEESTLIISSQFDSINAPPVKCKLCQKLFISTKKSNLKRHLKDLHPMQFYELGLDPEGDGEDLEPGFKKVGKVSVPIDKEFFTESCVKMVTAGGLPLSVFEKPGMREIFSKLQDALKVKISRNNLPAKIAHTAEKFRQKIIKDVKNRTVCLKLDSASRKGRSILGVNIQYLKDDIIVVRTLGLIDIMVAQTAENIREEVLKILTRFEIGLDQVYSITTDNGANFLKAVTLLKSEQRKIFEGIDYDCNPDEYNAEATEYDDNDIDNCSENESVVIADWDSEDENYEPISDDDGLARECDQPQAISGAILDGIRCAAHTLQLAVYDVIRSRKLKKRITIIKNVVSALRTKTWRHVFKLHRKPIATLECDTRWNSAYRMVEYFMEHKDFIQDVLRNDKTLKIGANVWKFIEEFSRSFKPVFTATLKLQNESITMGDFYFVWLTCRLELEEVGSSMANSLLTAMDRRQTTLIDNKAFLAAVHMDPRINYLGSSLISEQERMKAKIHLLSVWDKIKHRFSEAADDLNSTSSSSSSLPVSKIEQMLRLKESSSDLTQKTLEQKLLQLSLQPRVSADTNIHAYWKLMKTSEPLLYELSQVVLAAPCTQVSVERSFSALSVILVDRRLRLSDENLSNILFVKLNNELFSSVKLNFDEA